MPAPQRLYDARLQSGFAEGQVVGNRDARPGTFTDLRAKRRARFDQYVGVGQAPDTAAMVTVTLGGSATYAYRGKALAAAGKYNLYMDGTAINYLAGNLLLGTTTDGMTGGGSLAVAQDFAHRGTKVGFYNTAPITKPAITGNIAGNTALATVVAQLVAVGLMSSTATNTTPTPVTPPTVTGSRGGNAALASLLTALATLGIVTDSTTA
jgi:hypothetical protein